MTSSWRDSWRNRRAERTRRRIANAAENAGNDVIVEAILSNGMQGLFDTALPRPSRAEVEQALIEAALASK